MNNYSVAGEDSKQIKQIVQSNADVQTGFFELLNYCQTKWPHDVWEQVSKIEVQGDVDELKIWLDQTLCNEPPAGNIKAFWFGLYNPVLKNGEVTCRLYISGSTQFDPNTIDWACWREDSYVPKGRYAKSRVLRQIYSLVVDTEIEAVGEYALCLGFAGLAVKHIFGNSHKPVAVGFDSGDFIVVNQQRA